MKLTDLLATMAGDPVWIYSGNGNCDYFNSLTEACSEFDSYDVTEIVKAEDDETAAHIYVRLPEGDPLPLAHEILTERRLLSDLTFDQCVMLIDRFAGEDDVASLHLAIKTDEMDEREALAYAQLGAKVALSAAQDDDEYWAVYGSKEA